MSSLPVVDFSPYSDAGSRGKSSVAMKVERACTETGAFYLANHGVAAPVIDGMVDVAKEFFELPLDVKNRVHIALSPHHRGYFPVGEENAKGGNVQDLKEGFDIALELPPDDPDVLSGKPLHGPNVWPATPPRFRPALERYFAAMTELAHSVCDVFACALGVDDDFFRKRTRKPLAQFRILHYPPHEPARAGEPIGAGAHTDYGVVTLLWQDDVGGLEVRRRDGEWVGVTPIPGTLVCHIGDALARWTNDTWEATVHRVVNRSGRERYSAAFFFDPDFDCLIEPLPQFTGDRPARYPPISMGEYVTRSFDGTFAYRQEEAGTSGT